jgi:hypothetical protein
MTEFKLLRDDLDNAHNALKKLDEDFGGLHLGRVDDLILNVLKTVMDDKENDWIGYYIYEIEWGQKYKDGYVEQNNKNIKLKTFEDLYNILTKK